MLKTYQVLLRYGKFEAIYECLAFDMKDARRKAESYAEGTPWRVSKNEVVI